jgi:hypothetical protein
MAVNGGKTPHCGPEDMRFSDLGLQTSLRSPAQAIICYFGRFIVFFWSPVTGSKEQRSAKRRPAPGAPRPARRTLPLPAGCRAAA